MHSSDTSYTAGFWTDEHLSFSNESCAGAKWFYDLPPASVSHILLPSSVAHPTFANPFSQSSWMTTLCHVITHWNNNAFLFLPIAQILKSLVTCMLIKVLVSFFFSNHLCTTVWWNEHSTIVREPPKPTSRSLVIIASSSHTVSCSSY